MLLVDSNVYIDWLRKRELPEQHLRRWIIAGEAAICGIIRIEVLRGIIAPGVKMRMQSVFDAMIDVPTSNHLLYEATELAWALDRKEILLSVPDLLIAQVARQLGATLITKDSVFAKIPGVRVRPELPPG
ncbi:MAG TPA: PIN domain-containing protein [Kiritimatiellia bacterium]|nr:PIN domain-containing protein [Kiritimatiellia bacterium]